MVQPKYSPEEALQRVKLMMKYDSSKTLNENKKVITEQVGPNETASIASDIKTELLGDVKTIDLEDVHNILKTRVFGKTYEDGGCLLNKVMAYFAKPSSKKSDMFTTLMAFTPEIWGIGKSNLIDAINNSEEYSEPQFEDVKRKLINDIQSESNGFCKTGKPVTPGIVKNNNNVKTGTKGKVSGNKKTGGGYRPCAGAYSYGCKTDPTGAIGKVQGCLGLVQDGKFGPKTKAALQSKGFASFTDTEVDKICGKSQTTQTTQATQPQDEFNTQVDVERAVDILK